MIRSARFLLLLTSAAWWPAGGQVEIHFVDVAPAAGLTVKTVFGGEKTKRYILETTGGGAAFFDYDNDGWLDIFLVNGSSFEGPFAATNHLYRNNRDRTFRDDTAPRGLQGCGWGAGGWHG